MEIELKSETISWEITSDAHLHRESNTFGSPWKCLTLQMKWNPNDLKIASYSLWSHITSRHVTCDATNENAFAGRLILLNSKWFHSQIRIWLECKYCTNVWAICAFDLEACNKKLQHCWSGKAPLDCKQCFLKPFTSVQQNANFQKLSNSLLRNYSEWNETATNGSTRAATASGGR